MAATLAAAHLLAGCAATPAPRPPAPGTRVAVVGPHILVGDRPTTLLGFRVGSAALRDDWTEELLGQLGGWRRAGANALILWLQGTSGGFHPVFTEDGRFDPEPQAILARAGWGLRETRAANGRTSGQEILARTRRIVEAADRQGMAVIVGVMYRHAVTARDTRQTVLAAMRAAGEELGRHENVMFAVWNEADITRPLESVDSHRAYAQALRASAPGRPVCAGSSRAEMNPPLASIPEVDFVCQDAGRDLAATIAALEGLAAVPKPVVNVESFGGSGGGYVDRRAGGPAPGAPGVTIDAGDKGRWHRVFGAWEEDDYPDGTGRRLVGRRGYRTLIERVVGHPQRRWHVMVHAAAWFQGASRVGDPDQIGDARQTGTWNNVFHRGGGRGEGTVAEPGIDWLLSAFAAARGLASREGGLGPP